MKRSRIPFFAAACAASLLVPASSLLVGCDDGLGCTAMGCGTHYLRIDLPPELADGAWSFDVHADEMTWTCEVVLPVAEHTRANCSGFDLSLTVAPEGTDGAGTFWFAWMPQAVEIVARHEGSEVGRQSFVPNYDADPHYPNGPECEPACPFDEFDLTVGGRP